MKKLISRVAVVLVVVMIATIVMPLAACTKNRGTINITSLGGIPLSEIQVTVQRDGTDVITAVTNDNGELADANGKAISFKYKSGKYTAKLDGLPAGYIPDDSYEIDKSKAVNTLKVKSQVIDAEIPEDKIYLTGDIMYDFTLTKAYTYRNNQLITETVKLSDVLKEKKAVMLDFFYTTCTWCIKEYPSIVQAYEEYSDDLEILGIDNEPQDTETMVYNMVLADKVPYYMAKDNPDVTVHFGIKGYPTSVMIDRYGVVCEMTETQLEVEFWQSWFAKYTADDYSQDINIGNDVNGETIFVPDKPADWDAHMPESSAINEKINNTGVNITFTTDAAETAWPWDFSEDGYSIYPTNSGHRGTSAIIYASLNMPTGKVLAFDYKVSCDDTLDSLNVAVDGRSGIGKQTFSDSGNKNWTTGYAYISLEAGVHEIAFVYYKTSASGLYDDKVYINNLRLIDVSELGNASLDIPYFAARDNDPETGGFNVYADVALESDGFYHVQGHASNGVNPILMADIQNATPYFTNAKSSIYNNYIKSDNCFFGGKDYYELLNSYNVYAGNSDIKGLVPVTAELQKALDALYKNENFAGQDHYSSKGWLEFCVFYKHYGPGDSVGNPIEGLAYFCAFEAHETTNEPNDGNLNDVVFEKLLMPRGYLYKFVPNQSGAYMISGLSTSNGTDGWLYDGGLNVATTAYPTMNTSGYDDFVRDKQGASDADTSAESFDDFKMYNYLEAGKTYYILVAIHVADVLGEFKFRIDRLGDDYNYLTTVTSGFYSLDENSNIRINVYADVKYDEEKDVFYDATYNMPIYCDFTSVSRMFTNVSIETILKGATEQRRNYFNLTGVSYEIDGKIYEGEDYTEVMKAYLEEAKSRDIDDPLYGMVEVDWKLQVILKLIYVKYVGFDDENEWLKACWYFVHVSA